MPPGKKPTPRQATPYRKTAEVKPISPVGLIGAIAAALVIAAILLFVINSRLNAARPSAPVATPSVAAVTTPSADTPAASTTGGSGFSEGNTQAKVTVTEFGDFK